MKKLEKVSKFSEEQKKKMHDELMKDFEASGLKATPYAKQRLGFKDGSKFNHIVKNWNTKGYVGEGTWTIVEKHLNKIKGYTGIVTRNMELVFEACRIAYLSKEAVVVSGSGGFGKTFALKKYKESIEKEGTHKVIYFDASMTSTRKQFVVELMNKIKCHKSGVIDAQILMIKEALATKKVVLIIDEVSSLKGERVTLIKDIITALKNVCGIVLAGTPYFMNNVYKGAAADKHLFSELKDRLYSIIYTLSKPSEEEANAIFIANGISGEELDIVMGKNKKLLFRSYKAKETFRGIANCITMIGVLQQDQQNLNIKYLQAI